MKKRHSFLLGVTALGTAAAMAYAPAGESPRDYSKPSGSWTEISARTQSSPGISVSLDLLERPDSKPRPGSWQLREKAPRKSALSYQAPDAQSTSLSADVNVLGQLVYDEGNSFDADNNTWLGFYSLPHSTGADWTLAGYTDGPINFGGYADFVDNVYRGVYMEMLGSTVTYKYMVTFDLTTFENISTVEMDRNTCEMAAFAVAQNPVDRKVYGCYVTADGSGIYWGTGDYITSTVSKIADLTLDERLMGLAFDDDGQAYGLRETTYGSKKLELVKVDCATGSQEVIGQTNLPFQYKFGTCWNSKDHNILATYNTTDYGSGLMAIDPATATASLISDFQADREVTNLFIRPDSETLIPAAPQLEVTAPEGSMTCHYVITMPDKLTDGSALTGNVEWRITLDGETKAEGSTAAGESASGDITLSTTGYADFIAYAFNASGRSNETRAHIFVGKGLAASPSEVTLSYDAETSTMTATWQPVTTSADGGYINPEEVTYTVTDSDGTVLASGLTGTSFSKEVAEPAERTEFSWTVTACYDSRQSTPATSNVLALGPLAAPFDYDFTVRKDFFADGFTVIDANNDGCTFDLNGLGARCGHAATNINMDDWLVTPGIFLKANQSYVFTLTAHCYQESNTENVEVKVGTAPTVAGLTTYVINNTSIRSNRTNPSILTGVFTPTADGTYYFGAHARTTSNKGNTTYHVMIPHMSLSGALDPLSPQTPANVKVIPATDGSLKAGVSYTAPNKNLGGTTYSPGPTGMPMLTMQLFVGDEDTPRQTMQVAGASGDSFNFPQTVEVAERGDLTVRVVAVAPTGQSSQAAEATAYVGPYEPKRVYNVKLTEVYQPGTVRLEWDAVTQDVNDNALPAGHTSYMIYTRDADYNYIPLLDEPIQATSYEFDALDDVNRQQFKRYFIGARNWDFEARSYGESNYTPVGVPYELPVRYSNMADTDNKACAFASQGNGQFVFFQAGSIPSQDADDEFFGCRGTNPTDAAKFRTGKISLINAKNPELIVYTYKPIAAAAGIIQAGVICNGGDEEVIKYYSQQDMEDGKWVKCRFDLSKWRNRNVEVVVTLGVMNISDCYADNFTIQDTPATDLAVTGIEAPAMCATGENFSITATVENLGSETSPAAKATLIRDGEAVQTKDIEPIGCETTATVTFEDAIRHFAADDCAIYSVEVAVDGDADTDNNSSAAVTVLRKKSSLGIPETLSGESTAEGLLINWQPAAATAEESVTESFEDGDPWTNYFQDWTFLDRDGKALGTINELEIPCVEHGTSTGSFFVFDMEPYSADKPENLDAHSGSKFLFSMYRVDGRQVDDWAISPLLNGREQTISLWAKRLSQRYIEELEILYTMADDAEFNYDNWTKVEGFGTQIVPAEWTEYTALIPAGATHFAVRSRAANSMMLMIDDVTFAPKQASLAGYNLYRNGQRLNDELLTATSYLDPVTDRGTHTYHATAVYTEGESELSEPLHIQYSGLNDASTGTWQVTVIGHDIIVTGAENASTGIAAVDGRVLATATGDIRHTVAAPGVYLVTVGSATLKVIVK